MTTDREKTGEKSGPSRFSEEKQGLADLDKRLNNIRNQQAPPSGLGQRIKAPPGNVLGLAFRVSVELLSALAVGTAIGWSLDLWLETGPWLMLVFIVLGGAAGILNVYRLASGFGYAAGYKPGDEDAEDADKADDKRQA